MCGANRNAWAKLRAIRENLFVGKPREWSRRRAICFSGDVANSHSIRAVGNASFGDFDDVGMGKGEVRRVCIPNPS